MYIYVYQVRFQLFILNFNIRYIYFIIINLIQVYVIILSVIQLFEKFEIINLLLMSNSGI